MQKNFKKIFLDLGDITVGPALYQYIICCKFKFVSELERYFFLEILCPSDLLAPKNGKVLVPFQPGLDSVTNYDCDEGFYLDGPGKTTCKDNDNNGKGEWDTSLPNCTCK